MGWMGPGVKGAAATQEDVQPLSRGWGEVHVAQCILGTPWTLLNVFGIGKAKQRATQSPQIAPAVKAGEPLAQQTPLCSNVASHTD